MLLWLILASPLPHPDPQLLQAASALRRDQKEVMWVRCAQMGLCDPEREEPDYENFAGIMVIVHRRHLGLPLRYPADPVFGQRD